MLVALGIRPDHLASHDRAVTQAIARRIHADAAEFPGFRWWSALTGDWHVGLLFLDRVDVRSIGYAAPEATDVTHPAVRAAARFLRMS